MIQIKHVPDALLKFATGILLAFQIFGPNAEAATKPNIVFIMSDELAYYEVSYMGHPQLQTPNIDKLAAEGIRFTQGLAGSSVCAPTRCVLMTGKHSGRTSVRKNGGGTPLRAGEITVASILKAAGYATGGFGKWGCGGRGSTGVPEEHGFDQFVGYYDQVHAHSFYPAYIIRNSKELPLPGNKGGRSGKTYSHYVIMDEAMKFIEDNHDRPFFCYLPITPPHGMYDIPDTDPSYQIFKDKPWPAEAIRYAAMVHMVDRNVGEVLALLKKHELEKNTLVIFCGDNGGQARFKSKEHPSGFFKPNVNPKTGLAFRGSKGNLYEGGLRIPMVANWPGRIAPGQVSNHLWYFPDFLPTVAEISGASPPDDIDGISIAPTLFGAKAAGHEQEKHKYLFWEIGSQTAVRMNHWKAIQTKPNRPWELYDLSSDLGEQTNLATRHPGTLSTMKRYAKEAHTPVVEGTFADTALHQKDRRAKWGEAGAPAAANKRSKNARR